MLLFSACFHEDDDDDDDKNIYLVAFVSLRFSSHLLYFARAFFCFKTALFFSLFAFNSKNFLQTERKRKQYADSEQHRFILFLMRLLWHFFDSSLSPSKSVKFMVDIVAIDGKPFCIRDARTHIHTIKIEGNMIYDYVMMAFVLQDNNAKGGTK